MILRLIKGSEVALLESQEYAPVPVSEWSIEDQRLLIDEGRRRFDAEVATLNDVRSRAQLVLSTSLVVLAALASGLSERTFGFPALNHVVSAIGFFAGGVAALGAASVVVVGAPMGVISLPDLTRAPDSGMTPIEELATKYLMIATQNRRVVRTWQTHFFESVVWLLVASACAVIGFL